MLDGRFTQPRGALVAAVLATTLTACATIAPDRLDHDARYAIPVGSTLVLNQTLELPGRGNLLYFQDGRSVRYGQVQEVYPHCYVETWERPEGRLRVEPTTFTISGLNRSFYYTGLPVAPGGGLVKVSTGGDSGDGGSISRWFYVTRMDLTPRDPAVEVFRLTCQADRLDASGPETERHYLTVAQIRQALGSIFTLKI